jgi:hypothetical protein
MLKLFLKYLAYLLGKHCARWTAAIFTTATMSAVQAIGNRHYVPRSSSRTFQSLSRKWNIGVRNSKSAVPYTKCRGSFTSKYKPSLLTGKAYSRQDRLQQIF